MILPKLITNPAQIMKEIPELFTEMAQDFLVPIYDCAPDQIGTGFLTIRQDKPFLVTAMHTLYGHAFNENPLKKKIFIRAKPKTLMGELRELGDICTGKLANSQVDDVAIAQITPFIRGRCLSLTNLAFSGHNTKFVTIGGFLSRDFKRSRSKEILAPKPYIYTGRRLAPEGNLVKVEYLNRATTTATGKNELAPVPRGLSGTFMLSTIDLILGKLKVLGIFTDGHLDQGHVFGAPTSAIQSLFESADF